VQPKTAGPFSELHEIRALGIALVVWKAFLWPEPSMAQQHQHCVLPWHRLWVAASKGNTNDEYRPAS
jgi:hypothetical protein